MDTPAIGMRFRLVKALYSASLAKQVFCFAAAEAIGRQLLLPGKEREAFMWDEQMQVARGRANRTIAVEHVRLWLTQGFEANGSAMASACDANQIAHSTVTDFARLRG